MYPAVVRGYPNPEMVWLCDDQPVQQTEDVVVNELEDHRSPSIPSVHSILDSNGVRLHGIAVQIYQAPTCWQIPFNCD